MSKKFNVDNYKKLESEKRNNDLPPEKTLINMLLKKGDHVIDLGAGIGYFSLPATKIVGNHGTVYALDTSKKMLKELNKRVKQKGIQNIKVIKSDLYDSNITKKVDYLLMVNVLHEVNNKNLLLKNYIEKLKQGAKIGIIEFKKTEMQKGPSLEHKLSILDIKKLFDQNKISVLKEVEINDYQYGIVGVNNNK
ncbi:MAG: methyltransferase domain-containing protein [Halanaerobiales bacterium]|nr:methyltransferase domain-containing protein [Halanaerobiales bacterium]